VTLYNEIDPFAAAWLRELIAAGHIAPGTVDETPIQELSADALRAARRVHFFAGIGGWDYALRLAGWPDDLPVWTGSCPCQPFSAAGKGLGADDPRHLWPAMFRLIRECRPSAIFGEQVASAVRHGWLDGVFADLEGEGYACGAHVLGAHSAGAPHIRQRLFWVAYADPGGSHGGGPCLRRGDEPAHGRHNGGLADAPRRGLGIDGSAPREPGHAHQRSEARGVGHSIDQGPQGHGRPVGESLPQGRRGEERHAPAPGVECGAWGRFDILPCFDGKARRVESGVEPLVAGLPRGVVRDCDPGAPINANATAEARVMRLRGYGNSIVPQVAASFIAAAMQAIATPEPTP
jgi:DNA (cytosine-5)-methyltransferase 1